MDFETPRSKHWESLRRQAARRLPADFPARVLRVATRRRVLRGQAALALATAVILLLGVGAGHRLAPPSPPSRDAAARLHLQYREAQRQLIATL